MLNVKDFGAKADGSADDTAALRAALTQAAGMFGTVPSGNAVYLPAGHYITSAPLAVGANTRFYGDSRTSSFIDYKGTDPDAGAVRLVPDFQGFAGNIQIGNLGMICADGMGVYAGWNQPYSAVFAYSASSGAFADVTASAAKLRATPFTLVGGIGDYCYFGHTSKAPAANPQYLLADCYKNFALKYEYWNGSGWTAFSPGDLSYGQRVVYHDWAPQSDWQQTSVNGSAPLYFFRIHDSISAQPIQATGAGPNNTLFVADLTNLYISAGNTAICLDAGLGINCKIDNILCRNSGAGLVSLVCNGGSVSRVDQEGGTRANYRQPVAAIAAHGASVRVSDNVIEGANIPITAYYLSGQRHSLVNSWIELAGQNGIGVLLENASDTSIDSVAFQPTRQLRLWNSSAVIQHAGGPLSYLQIDPDDTISSVLIASYRADQNDAGMLTDPRIHIQTQKAYNSPTLIAGGGAMTANLLPNGNMQSGAASWTITWKPGFAGTITSEPKPDGTGNRLRITITQGGAGVAATLQQLYTAGRFSGGPGFASAKMYGDTQALLFINGLNNISRGANYAAGVCKIDGYFRVEIFGNGGPCTLFVEDAQIVAGTRFGFAPQPSGPANIQSSAMPTVGTFNVGDRCWNSSPASGQPVGWVCVAAGIDAAASWKSFGAVN